MRKIFIAVILSILALQCTPDYEEVKPIVYISNNTRDKGGRTFSDCTIRYTLINSFKDKDKTVLQGAVRDAFGLWQSVNRNLIYIESPVSETSEILVRFADPSEIEKTEITTSTGLLSATIKNLSSIKQSISGQFSILLDNSYDWTNDQITKTVAYNIGFFLGLATSTNKESIMYPVYSNTPNKIIKEDSVQINTLYLLPCRTTSVGSLPVKFKLGNQMVVKEFLTGKAGTIAIRSSGIMVVGPNIGESTPDGKDVLYFLIPIDKVYYVVPNYPHGSIMYRFNNDTEWLSCKSNCEFTTRGNEFISISFLVNDSMPEENTGSYDVEINYK